MENLVNTPEAVILSECLSELYLGHVRIPESKAQGDLF